MALSSARTAGKFEAQGWRVRKDGSRFWTSVHIEPAPEADGTLIGDAEVTRDLSQNLHADQALFASEERFRLLVQGARPCDRHAGAVAHDFNNLLTLIRSSAELLRRNGHDEIRRARYVKAITDPADRTAPLTRQ